MSYPGRGVRRLVLYLVDELLESRVRTFQVLYFALGLCEVCDFFQGFEVGLQHVSAVCGRTNRRPFFLFLDSRVAAYLRSSSKNFELGGSLT